MLLVLLLAGHGVLSVVKVPLQLRLDVARILALRNGDDALDHHGPYLRLPVNHRLQLVAHGQEQEIRERNAVDGRNERRGDAVTELSEVREVLPDRPPSPDRTDDGERRRVNTHGLEDLGRLGVEMLHRVQLDFHAGADGIRLAAVDQGLQPLLQECVLLSLHRGLEAQQSLLARDIAPLHYLLDHRRRIVRRRHEYPGDDLPGSQESRQRRLHQACGKCPHHYDDERRASDQRPGAAALQDGAADDRYQRKHDADDAQDIHGLVRLQPLREPCAQAHQRLAVNLTDARLGYLQHLADLAQIHVFVVVQRQHQLLALGQSTDGAGERIAKAGILDMVEGARPLVAGVVRGTRLILARPHLIEAEQAAAGRILHQLVIFLDGHAATARGVVGARILPLGVFYLAYDVGHLAHASMHRAWSPIGLAYLVEHGAADPDARVGLEIRALRGGIVLGRVEQADHSGLDQIVNFHVRRHPAHQVVGDSLDQIAMCQHQFLLRHVGDL